MPYESVSFFLKEEAPSMPFTSVDSSATDKLSLSLNDFIVQTKYICQDPYLYVNNKEAQKRLKVYGVTDMKLVAESLKKMCRIISKGKLWIKMN